jgi:hypothetical protein
VSECVDKLIARDDKLIDALCEVGRRQLLSDGVHQLPPQHGLDGAHHLHAAATEPHRN